MTIKECADKMAVALRRAQYETGSDAHTHGAYVSAVESVFLTYSEALGKGHLNAWREQANPIRATVIEDVSDD